MMTRAIAVYGKGGIGKSTFSSNVAAVYGEEGLKTLLVGCDPKSDSAINIVGSKVHPILDLMRQKRGLLEQEYIVSGFNGVQCVEIGGPEPGIGCAGRGLIIGIKHIIDKGVLGRFDMVIFDVPADIVCGGLAVVVKEGYAEGALIVTSDEFMSIFAANNLCRGFKTLGVKVGGLVYNRASQDGSRYIDSFSQRIGLAVLGSIPSSELIKKCDRLKKTIIEAAPESIEAKAFRDLAMRIRASEFQTVPNPLTEGELGCAEVSGL